MCIQFARFWSTRKLKSHVATLVHAYYAAFHNNTRFFPYNRLCLSAIQDMLFMSVVVALFYSVPVGLHRICSAEYPRYSEWDGPI